MRGLEHTESFFSMLGAAPELGRTFTADDLARGCSVVLSHGFWSDTLDAMEALRSEQEGSARL